jgi:hypothetical protein
VAGLLLLFSLIGLALLYRRRRERAKFTAPQLLRGFICDATIRPGGDVELSPDPGDPRFNDFEALLREGRDSRQSQFIYPPFSFRAHASLRPGGQATGEVTAAGRQLLAGRASGPLVSSDNRTRARVPLKPAGTWLFALTSIDAAGVAQGRLAVLTDVDSVPELGARTLDAARVALASQDWTAFESARAEVSAEENERYEKPVRAVDIDDIDWNSP